MLSKLWDNEISRDEYDWQCLLERESEAIYHDVMVAIEVNFGVKGVLAHKLAIALAEGRHNDDLSAWDIWDTDLQLTDLHCAVILNKWDEVDKHFTQIACWNRGDD